MSETTRTGVTGKLCPLSDSESYIRLLEVVAGSDQHSLDFRLSQHRLTELPPYHAISYVWGSKAGMCAITVNEQSFQVRLNCRNALQQAKSYGGSHYYWIDAICIDQEDLGEKSHQVQMMGDIFDKATNVLSCVGEAENDSEKVMKMLLTIPGDLVDAVWPGMVLDKKVMAWLTAQSNNDLEGFSDSLTALLLRPYFTRVWILQEVFRKQSRTILCCGVHHAPLKALFALKRALYHSQGCSYYEGNLIEDWISYASYDFPSRCSSFLLDVSFSGQRASNRTQKLTTEDGKDGLEEALEMASAFECTDVRDKIYGILPLIDWASQKPIFPDYHKSRFELVLAIMKTGWRNGQFATLERVVMLIKMFELFEQDESMRQFGETASAIVARCQEKQPKQMQDEPTEHERHLFRQRLQEIGSKPLENGQQGMFLLTSSMIKETALLYRNPLWQIDASRARLGEDLSGWNLQSEGQQDSIVLDVSANRDGELWVTALHLSGDTDSLNRTSTRRPPQSYDMFLAVEDALIISFVMASVGTVPKPAIKRFLDRLVSAQDRFSSYVKASESNEEPVSSVSLTNRSLVAHELEADGSLSSFDHDHCHSVRCSGCIAIVRKVVRPLVSVACRKRRTRESSGSEED